MVDKLSTTKGPRAAVPPIERGAVLAACAAMVKGCGITLVELAQALGQPLVAPVPVPAPAVAGRAVHRARPLTLEAQKVVDLVDRPEGATVLDIAAHLQVGDDTAGYHCKRLVERGALVVVKVPGERCYRYFTTQQRAAAWTGRAAAAAAQRAAAGVVAARTPAVAAPAAAAPVAAGCVAEARTAAPVAAAVSKSRAQQLAVGKKNISFSAPAPPPAPRASGEVLGMDTAPRSFTPAPAHPLEAPDSYRGPFSTGGKYIPGIDPMTGKPWEKRA